MGWVGEYVVSPITSDVDAVLLHVAVAEGVVSSPARPLMHGTVDLNHGVQFSPPEIEPASLGF